MISMIKVLVKKGVVLLIFPILFLIIRRQGSQAIDDHIVRDDHIADNGLIDELIIRDEDFDCHSEDSNDDSILIGNYKEDNVDQVGSEPEVEASNWRGLFQTVNSLSKLEYFAPKIAGGKVVVSPPEEAVEEGIDKWKTSLVGQFLDKPLPYFLLKKICGCYVEAIWEVEVFSLENGMYIFRFSDEATYNEVMEARIWHVANKPLILRKWSPGMQVLNFTLTSIAV
jgi:hypothetical protein